MTKAIPIFLDKDKYINKKSSWETCPKCGERLTKLISGEMYHKTEHQEYCEVAGEYCSHCGWERKLTLKEWKKMERV